MTSMNWKQGLLRLYCALWGAGAAIMLASMVYELYDHFDSEYVLEYVGMWLGFAVIAPAGALGLIVWVVRGFAGRAQQDKT